MRLMSTRMTRVLGVTATVVALGGVALITADHLNAQGAGGRGGRFGGPGAGGPGGPGGGRRGGGPGGPGAMGPSGLSPMMLERLDLTDAQRTRVREIMDSHRTEQQALGERARAAHEKLEAAIAGDTFDESAVRTYSAEAGTVQADLAVARARIYAEVLQVLTADQQTKLKELQANVRERQDKMRENRGERRGRL
jgi:periplasmic protein CpxP/Spy